MLTNRSIPSSTVIPVLVYPDVRAAVAWLTEAFGFAELVRIGDAHRSQMRVGSDGAVIVGEAGSSPRRCRRRPEDWGGETVGGVAAPVLHPRGNHSTR